MLITSQEVGVDEMIRQRESSDDSLCHSAYTRHHTPSKLGHLLMKETCKIAAKQAIGKQKTVN